MPIGELPLWGQWGILGLSIGFNIFCLIRYANGLWVARTQLEDVMKSRDMWQHAWEVSQQTNHDVTQLLVQLTVTAQTMEKVLNALPPVQTARVVVVHPDGTSRGEES